MKKIQARPGDKKVLCPKGHLLMDRAKLEETISETSRGFSVSVGVGCGICGDKFRVVIGLSNISPGGIIMDRH